MDLGLRVLPTAPKDLDSRAIREKAIEIVLEARLPEPIALALTGSRVWKLESEDSDVDVLAYGNYAKVRDLLGSFGGKELEVTTIPISSVE